MAERDASPRIDKARLKLRRLEAGLSISDLARRIGISPQYMNQIERGHRPTVSPSTYNKILVAMGIEDRDDLLVSIEQDAA